MTGPCFTIRRATMEDYNDLCELWTVLDEHHRLAKPHSFRKPLGAVREVSEVQDLVDGPDSTILVAQDGAGTPQAFASVIVRRRPEKPVRPAREFAEVDALVVAPAARRGGMARALINAADDWAKARGLGPLELAVHEFNAGALAFYEALGFATDTRWMKRKS